MDSNLRVVIAAAGTGSRMKSSINKQYMLLKSKPVLAYSLDVFEKSLLVDEIVVVVHSEEITYCDREVIKKYNYKKVKSIIPGGKERQDSVWSGLKELSRNTALVAVHDGARPLVMPEMINCLVNEAREWGAAIPGVKVKDTLKMIGSEGVVEQTLDRSRIVAIQTPQVFNYQQLLIAYEKANEEGFSGTDDASLYERYIGKVKVVPGNNSNIKITTPEDLVIAETLLDVLFF